MELLEEMYKEHKKVKDKGSSKTTAFHLHGYPPVEGCSSYCYIIVSRVRPNTDYRLQKKICQKMVYKLDGLFLKLL